MTFMIRMIVLVPVIVSLSAAADNPLINTGGVDTATNTLTLTGINLMGSDGSGPTSVQVGVAPPISLTVTSSSATSITATFPSGSPASNLTAGSYLVTVSYHNGKAQVTLTVGSGPYTSTTLLFPYVANAAGFDTGIAIANVSDTRGSGTTGSCLLNFMNSAGPTVINTRTIASGDTYSDSLSVVAPSFVGYVIARCNFNAQGLAYIVDTAGFESATSYLAIATNP